MRHGQVGGEQLSGGATSCKGSPPPPPPGCQRFRREGAILPRDLVPPPPSRCHFAEGPPGIQAGKGDIGGPPPAPPQPVSILAAGSICLESLWLGLRRALVKGKAFPCPGLAGSGCERRHESVGRAGDQQWGESGRRIEITSSEPTKQSLFDPVLVQKGSVKMNRAGRQSSSCFEEKLHLFEKCLCGR